MPRVFYKCEFCEEFESSDQRDVLDHEFSCSYNKENKKCCTCKHYSVPLNEYWSPECKQGDAEASEEHTCAKWEGKW